VQISRVGVVGCGFMGSGIAQVCARCGYDVVVVEVSEPVLSAGLATIEHYLRRDVEKGRMTQKDHDSTRTRIKGSVAMDDLGDCDLLVEAVPEDLELKKRVFVQLDRICQADAILCSNTSCLSLTEIAGVTGRPDKVIGTHFLTPVPRSRLLEVVRADTTTEQTLETVREFGRSLGLEVLVAKDTPGFIFNYLLMALVGSAIRLLEDDVASAEDIDKSMVLGLGLPIGPLALADFNGLDVSYMVARAMYERTKDQSLAPSSLLRRMVESGHLGRKTGEGFYKYQKDQ
jgi:3-hydroxybutyryl-CoA dehydrogenase